MYILESDYMLFDDAISIDLIFPPAQIHVSGAKMNTV